MNRLFGVLIVASAVLGWGTMARGRVSMSSGPGTPQKGQGAQEKQGQTGRQGTPATPPSQAAQEEAVALQAIQNELDPDKAVQLVSDFEKKFPTSNYIGFVFLRGAFAYQQKGDLPHLVEYGEKSLKVQADNPVALILVASALPEPQSLRGNDLDKEKKLSEAEEYGTRALKLIEQFPKQPNETDEQFQKRKAALTSWAHSSLGMVHLQRSGMALTGVDKEEVVKAEKEYQTAVSLSDRPNPGDYYRLGETYVRVGKIDEALAAFSKASELSEGTELKKLADDQVEQLKKAKSGAKPPAKP